MLMILMIISWLERHIFVKCMIFMALRVFFLAAYNGARRLDDFLTHNRKLPLENRRYVASIGPQIQGIKPNRQSQADLMVEGHENGMGVNAVQYAAATQAGFQRMALSPQAQAVQNAWQNRQTTETLNQASLNGTSSATTDSLNRQSLQGAGSAATQVAMASPLPSQPAVSTYPVKWKNLTLIQLLLQLHHQSLRVKMLNQHGWLGDINQPVHQQCNRVQCLFRLHQLRQLCHQDQNGNNIIDPFPTNFQLQRLL